MESQDDSPLANLYLFVIEKVISANLKLKTDKKLKKHADFLLKMKIFHTKKIIAYPYQNLDISKGVMRSQELSLCPLEDIKKELKPQGVTEVKRVSIKRVDKLSTQTPTL